MRFRSTRIVFYFISDIAGHRMVTYFGKFMLTSTFQRIRRNRLPEKIKIKDTCGVNASKCVKSYLYAKY